MRTQNLEKVSSPLPSSERRCHYRHELRNPVYVEAFDYRKHTRFLLRTWLFNISRRGACFNADRGTFREGMRIRVVAPGKIQINASVKWVREQSHASQKVGVEFEVHPVQSMPIA